MHLNSSEVRAKDNYRKSSVIKTLAPWAHVRDSYWREIQNHSSNYVIHKCNNIHKQQRAGKDFPRHVRVGVGQSEPSTSGLTVNV